MAMADAHNLTWKLAAILRGWGGPGLLPSYDTERGPVNRGTCTVNQAMWTSMAKPGSAAAPTDLRMLDMGYRYASNIGPDAEKGLDTAATYIPSASPGGRAPPRVARRRPPPIHPRRVRPQFRPGVPPPSRSGHRPWPATEPSAPSQSRPFPPNGPTYSPHTD
jgi:hypothetical protein